MVNTENQYFLPCHPSIHSADPLGVCDDDNPTAWAVIVATINAFRTNPKHTIHQLPSLIQDISYSVKMDGNLNTEFLSQFLLRKYPDAYSLDARTTLNNILDMALSLPASFPSETIQCLSESHPLCRLSFSQISSLLSHQILNTLSAPPGNNWGCTFACWYSGTQPLENAVFGYLSTLFDFFTLTEYHQAEMTYRFYTKSCPSDPEEHIELWRNCRDIKAFDNIIIESVTKESVPFPHPALPCTLVASNKSPGFGPACTQEELVTAACPPLLPLGALLVAPPVPSDTVILASGYVPLAHWQGQGRQATYLQIPNKLDHHTFVLADASELDQVEAEAAALPDLQRQIFLRDLHKVYTAFSAIAELDIRNIASPLWGAGSFGGNPVVKALILSAAAARAGITVHLSVDDSRLFETSSSGRHQGEQLLMVLEELVTNAKLSVGLVMERLSSNVTDIYQLRRLFDV